jgi:hypothetical protein
MAAETKIIPTITSLTVSGNDIEIRTEYLDITTLPDTLSADITEVVGMQDNTPYIEGELIIKMKNSPPNISYLIDNNGDLILIDITGDTANYSVDSNGELIYTF